MNASRDGSGANRRRHARQRERRLEERAGSLRAVDVEDAAERLHAVLEAAEPGRQLLAALDARAPDAVIADDDGERSVVMDDAEPTCEACACLIVFVAASAQT